MPSNLTVDQVSDSYKTSLTGAKVTIGEEVESALEDFELPLSFGLGLTTKFNSTLNTSFDFTKLHWNNTNQLQNNERYTDQNIYAFGVEYLPVDRNKYWSLVKYRFGVNYNTGFLNISDQKIDSYFASVGLGLPLSNKAKLNIAYSYGREGTINKGLVQENFHKLTINLNFIGNWFNKRKYD